MHDQHLPTHPTNAVSGEPSLESWLAAEARDDERDAELALAWLVQSLPAPSPSPGFAERVLVRTNVHQAALDRARRRERRSLWIAGSTLTAVCGAALLVAAFDLVSVGSLVAQLGATLAQLGQLVALVLALWSRIIRLGELGRTIAATPELTTGLFVLILLAGVAWASLSVLLERSRRHVEA